MAVPTHTRKKVEMFVERPLLKRVLEVVKTSGARRYTVVPALEGRGLDGAWNEGLPVDGQHMVQVVVLTNEAKADAILEGMETLLQTWPGVVCVSDIQVMRPERFS
ncbi:hypothetical protein F1188_02530 [Roseospira marina]|uniref:Nitrogen regulatory protein P-II n=1 Tax=Roseospira marina TaxID=140057 RepID=A0A5M6IHL1_9PROT|nr:hypothetical protein [Roseospira marina]KAA5607652.1 hypothetical protein F1188_02530 [Roseospira marina]MBB4312147.1 hypothetical protein [Roseospira marina]MBB5085837.1 hypothetical protein [Roseospira marina]